MQSKHSSDKSVLGYCAFMCWREAVKYCIYYVKGGVDVGGTFVKL